MPITLPTTAGTTGEPLRGSSGSAPALPSFIQNVVIVNGRSETLSVLETVLEAGRYDVTFADSSEHAYSQIKRVRPDLIVLYMRIEDMHGFQLLSMLKLDADTRKIPVLTYTTEFEGRKAADDTFESDHEIFSSRPAPRMN